MKTEQINIRLDADLVAALERVAREEALDRTTTVRRLLETSIEDELRDLFGRDVDLVDREAVVRGENDFRRRQILATAEPVYVEG